MSRCLFCLLLVVTLGACSSLGSDDDSVDEDNLAVLVVDYEDYTFEGASLQRVEPVFGGLPLEPSFRGQGDFSQIAFRHSTTLDTVFHGHIVWNGQGRIERPAANERQRRGRRREAELQVAEGAEVRVPGRVQRLDVPVAPVQPFPPELVQRTGPAGRRPGGVGFEGAGGVGPVHVTVVHTGGGAGQKSFGHADGEAPLRSLGMKEVGVDALLQRQPERPDQPVPRASAGEQLQRVGEEAAPFLLTPGRVEGGAQPSGQPVHEVSGHGPGIEQDLRAGDPALDPGEGPLHVGQVPVEERRGDRIVAVDRRKVLPEVGEARVVGPERRDAGANVVAAEPQHGIAMYGDPVLPPDFEALPYVNPEAPKGGEMAVSWFGTFDSMNPYTRKGRAGYLSSIFFESILTGVADEVGSTYCLLCETIEYPESRDWVIFNLRDDVTFSDGTPMTAEDVVFTYELFLEEGLPSFRAVLGQQVAGAEALDEHRVKFTFQDDAPRRDVIETAGGLPIFSKAWFEANDAGLDESRLEPAVGTGPYMLDDYDINQRIVYRRNPDYWGAEHPLNIGRHNFDTIRVEYFGDSNAAFEGFKGGAYLFRNENSSKTWATGYDFPAVEEGVERERVALAGRVDLDDVFEGGALVPDGPDGLADAGVRHQDAGAAVLEAVLERPGAEQHGQRHRDGAEFPGGEVREEVRGLLRDGHADPITPFDAEGGESVREPVRQPVEVRERVRLPASVRGGLVERRPVHVVVFPEEVVGGVVALGDLPGEGVPGRLVAVVVEFEVPRHASELLARP